MFAQDKLSYLLPLNILVPHKLGVSFKRVPSLCQISLFHLIVGDALRWICNAPRPFRFSVQETLRIVLRLTLVFILIEVSHCIILSGRCLARCREKCRSFRRINRVLANEVLIFGLLRLTSSHHEIFDDRNSGALFSKDDILVWILHPPLNCWDHIWKLSVREGNLGKFIWEQMVWTFVCRNIAAHHLQHCLLFPPLRFNRHHHNLFHVEVALGANQALFFISSLPFQILLISGEHLIIGVFRSDNLSYETWPSANTPINKAAPTIQRRSHQTRSLSLFINSAKLFHSFFLFARVWKLAHLLEHDLFARILISFGSCNFRRLLAPKLLIQIEIILLPKLRFKGGICGWIVSATRRYSCFLTDLRLFIHRFSQVCRRVLPTCCILLLEWKFVDVQLCDSVWDLNQIVLVSYVRILKPTIVVIVFSTV